jgi:hypothetical protein
MTPNNFAAGGWGIMSEDPAVSVLSGTHPTQECRASLLGAARTATGCATAGMEYDDNLYH